MTPTWLRRLTNSSPGGNDTVKTENCKRRAMTFKGAAARHNLAPHFVISTIRSANASVPFPSKLVLGVMWLSLNECNVLCVCVCVCSVNTMGTRALGLSPPHRVCVRVCLGDTDCVKVPIISLYQKNIKNPKPPPWQRAPRFPSPPRPTVTDSCRHSEEQQRLISCFTRKKMKEWRLTSRRQLSPLRTHIQRHSETHSNRVTAWRTILIRDITIISDPQHWSESKTETVMSLGPSLVW